MAKLLPPTHSEHTCNISLFSQWAKQLLLSLKQNMFCFFCTRDCDGVTRNTIWFESKIVVSPE